VSIDVRIDGLAKIRRGIAEAPKEIDRRRRATLAKGGILIRDEARRRIHSPGGHAARGIRSFVQGGDERAIIRPGNRAAIFAQRGRGPNTTPPGKRAALMIARRYGIPEEDARRIAIAIGRRGTKGRPVMQAALRAKRGDLRELFMRDVLKPVVEAIAT
jgi:hypothetical protein